MYGFPGNSGGLENVVVPIQPAPGGSSGGVELPFPIPPLQGLNSYAHYPRELCNIIGAHTSSLAHYRSFVNHLVQFGANKATVRNGLAPNCLSVSRRSYLPVYLSRETLVAAPHQHQRPSTQSLADRAQQAVPMVNSRKGGYLCQPSPSEQYGTIVPPGPDVAILFKPKIAAFFRGRWRLAANYKTLTACHRLHGIERCLARDFEPGSRYNT
jgi:hypothetical protein